MIKKVMMDKNTYGSDSTNIDKDYNYDSNVINHGFCLFATAVERIYRKWQGIGVHTIQDKDIKNTTKINSIIQWWKRLHRIASTFTHKIYIYMAHIQVKNVYMK